MTPALGEVNDFEKEENMKNQKTNFFMALGSMSFLLASACGTNPNINKALDSSKKQAAADLKMAKQKENQLQGASFAQSIQSIGYEFDSTDQSFKLDMSHLLDGKLVEIPTLVGKLGNATDKKVKNPETKAYLASADATDVEYTAKVECTDLKTDPTCDHSVIELKKATGGMASTIAIEHASMSLDDVVMAAAATSSTNQTIAALQKNYTDGVVAKVDALTSTASIDSLKNAGTKQLFQLELTFAAVDPKATNAAPNRKTLMVGAIGKAGQVQVTFHTDAKDDKGVAIPDVTESLTADASFDATKTQLTIVFGTDLTVVAQTIAAAPAAK